MSANLLEHLIILPFLFFSMKPTILLALISLILPIIKSTRVIISDETSQWTATAYDPVHYVMYAAGINKDKQFIAVQMFLNGSRLWEAVIMNEIAGEGASIRSITVDPISDKIYFTGTLGRTSHHNVHETGFLSCFAWRSMRMQWMNTWTSENDVDPVWADEVSDVGMQAAWNPIQQRVWVVGLHQQKCLVRALDALGNEMVNVLHDNRSRCTSISIGNGGSVFVAGDIQRLYDKTRLEPEVFVKQLDFQGAETWTNFWGAIKENGRVLMRALDVDPKQNTVHAAIIRVTAFRTSLKYDSIIRFFNMTGDLISSDVWEHQGYHQPRAIAVHPDDGQVWMAIDQTQKRLDAERTAKMYLEHYVTGIVKSTPMNLKSKDTTMLSVSQVIMVPSCDRVLVVGPKSNGGSELILDSLTEPGKEAKPSVVPPEPKPTEPNQQQPWKIALYVMGGLVGFMLLFCFGFFLWRRRGRPANPFLAERQAFLSHTSNDE
jgi:hypothetical protein